MKFKIKKYVKKFLDLSTLMQVLIIVFGTILFSISYVAVTGYLQPQETEKIAGVSACDNQKQLEQLSYLYDARTDTMVFREKMTGVSNFFKIKNQLPDITKEEFAKNYELMIAAAGYYDSTEKEISDIASKISNVKQCYLLDEKTSEEYRNFNKYDNPPDLETTKT